MEGRRHHVAVGNFEFASAHEELFADREGCLLRLGEALPAKIHLALRTVALLVQALLVHRPLLRSRSVSEAAGLPSASSVSGAAFGLAIAGKFPESRARLRTNHAEPGPSARHGFIVLLEKPLMMSLPFVLFTCGLGAAWLRQREVALGFWTAGLVVLLALFRAHYGDALNIAL